MVVFADRRRPKNLKADGSQAISLRDTASTSDGASVYDLRAKLFIRPKPLPDLLEAQKRKDHWKSVYVAALSHPIVRDRRDNRDVWPVRIGTSANWIDTISNTLRTGLPIHDQGIVFRLWCKGLVRQDGKHPADALAELAQGMLRDRGGHELARAYLDAGPEVDVLGLEHELYGLAQRHVIEVWDDEGAVTYWQRMAQARARKR